jgi:hypothetical protein
MGQKYFPKQFILRVEKESLFINSNKIWILKEKNKFKDSKKY